MTDKILLSPEEIENLYGIKQSTLAKWRHLGQGSDYFKLGGMVKYKAEEFDKWLETSRVRGY
jgi:hypothetical protein